MEQDVEKLQELVDQYDRIVFFGGAGVSTESGIPDFRSVDGLYNQKYDYPPETILSHTFFMRHTDEFYRFYRDKMLALDAKPNDAHKKLAEMEEAGKLTGVVTQNIDGLHQAAGSKHVMELHGSVHRNYCMKCHKFYDASYMLHSAGVPKCECGGVIKPDVVLYEEGLDNEVVADAIRTIAEAEVMIVGGTSLAVYPAAGLLDYFRGKALVLINKGATPQDRNADLLIQKPIGQIFSQMKIGDIVKLKKQHPCGSSEWEILRVGADFRLKCTGCGHQIMIARKLVEKNTRNLRKKSEENT